MDPISENGDENLSKGADNPGSTATLRALTTVATTLGGSAALGLFAAVIAPALTTVVAASALGLLGGFLATDFDKPSQKALDKQVEKH